MRSVHPVHQTEIEWQLRKQSALKALDTIRLCYEGLQGAAPPTTDDAERDLCRRVIDIHRAIQKGKPDRARRAAVRAGAVCLAILLDLVPKEPPDDPL